jgi:hypothetical protein
MLTALAAAWLGLASGCYSTTPHRAQVASNVATHDCTAAIGDVFTRSGFIQLPTPPRLSMLYGARTSGPYSPFMTTGAAVAVTIAPNNGGACHVTIEAVSPDADCVPNVGGVTGTTNCRPQGEPAAPPYPNGTFAGPACPTVPVQVCELSYAPGADNDAAVDELARRLQAALGPSARVN